MSESVLQVLMKMFLILDFLEGDRNNPSIKSNIFQYLSRFGLEVSNDKLDLFYSECYHNVYNGASTDDKIPLVIERICRNIEHQLQTNEKLFVVFCLFEYANLHSVLKNHVWEIITPLAHRCDIRDNELKQISKFIFSQKPEDFNEENFLIAKRKDDQVEETLEGEWIEKNKPQSSGNKTIEVSEIEGAFVFLHVASYNSIVFKYMGNRKFTFRNTDIQPQRFYFFEHQDAVLHDDQVLLTYRNVAQAMLLKDQNIRIVFSGKQLEYNPRFTLNSIKQFTFSEKSGNLVGLIGESIQDKQTLFQCLAGRVKPSKGAVTINGFDTYHDKYKLQGVIGYVPDVSLMFDKHTIYENFYYHTKLHYRHIDQKQAKDMILRILNDLGLESLKDIKWSEEARVELGNYQVKLLNLGIELIRDPYVILCIEPFRGLQASEIQKFVSILREQCMRGKLIVATASPPLLLNIREFDKVWIFDRKGFPIFNGVPEHAYQYFRKNSNTEHSIKGFFERKRSMDFWQLISEKEVNKKGEDTEYRKTSPETWHQKYLKHIEPEIKIHGYKNVLPRNFVNIPDIDKQFRIYFIRDLRTRFRKIAPYARSILLTVTLALLTGLFGRYTVDGAYIFEENRNLLFYIFASTFNVFVIGVWLGREEIRKEFEIVDRDSILLLSKYSYLNSKFIIITFFCLILIAIYTFLGNAIVGNLYLSLKYWLVLSVVAIAGVLVGLSISLLVCSFRCLNFLLSAVVFFQLLFSGKVIPYQNFPEPFNNIKYVNVLGDLSVIRWGYEALTVEQFKNNEYQKHFFSINTELSECYYETNYHLPFLDSLLTASVALTNRENPRQELMEKLNILQNELIKYEEKEDIFPFEFINRLSINDFTARIATETHEYLTYLSYRYFEMEEALKVEKLVIIDSIGQSKYQMLKSNYANKRIADEVKGVFGASPMVVQDYEVIRTYDPIFHYPDSNLGRSHLYAPSKKFNGQYVDTLYFNIIMILILASVLYVFLMTGGPNYISQWISFIENKQFGLKK